MFYFFFFLGAIQNVWHSWGGGGGVRDSVTKWHNAKVSRDFFLKTLSPIFAFWSVFKGFKDIIFGKIKISPHTGWGWGHGLISQNDTGGGVGSKKCHVLFECPLKAPINTAYPLYNPFSLISFWRWGGFRKPVFCRRCCRINRLILFIFFVWMKI